MTIFSRPAVIKPLKMGEEKFEEEKFMKMLVNLKDTQESIQEHGDFTFKIIFF